MLGDEKELLMNVFKFVLLTSIRFAFVVVLKAVLFVYTLSLSDGPLVGITPECDSRTGDTV